MNLLKRLFGTQKPAFCKGDVSGSKNYESLADEKRKEFDWQTQINGIEKPPFYLYPFCENGVTLLVTKYDGNTTGIAWYIIDDFTEDGRFKRVEGKEFGYTYGSGVETGKKETDAIYERIKAMRKVTKTMVTEGWA